MERAGEYFLLMPPAFAFLVTFLIWGVFRPLHRRAGRGLSRAQKVLAVCCLGYAAVIIAFAATMAGTGKRVVFLYRNPAVYVPFRFALAYVVTLPAVVALRTERSDQPSPLRHYRPAVALALAFVTFLVLVPLAFYGTVYLVMFGYFQSILHNPWQVLVPFLLAISVHLYFSRSALRHYSRRRRISYCTWLPFVAALLLCAVTFPVIFLPPVSYDWCAEYLSAKYGLEGTILYHMETLPKPLAIVHDQPPPAGFVVEYLVFGEPAVDYSAMND